MSLMVHGHGRIRQRRAFGGFQPTQPEADGLVLRDMRLRLVKSFSFEAAHWLPTFPEGHKCRRLHGHSFRFDCVVEGEVEPTRGYLIDYGDIKQVCDPIVRELDHYLLNDIAGLSNPTSEMIAVWLWNRIKPVLPLLDEIIVYETCSSACHYRGK
jgi:6-pyruvoyltetrahydropterin/6-carboxytetrahydropterin synthase